MRLIKNGLLSYLTGIIILTLGITLTIQSRLGTSPFDALLVGLHRTVGLTVGSWEIVVGLSMVLMNALLEKKRPEYFALLTSFITGLGIDSWLFILRGWIEPTDWIGQWICLILGLIFTGIGVASYLQSKFAPNPMDRSMLVISQLTGWKVTYSRALIGIVLVVLALLFNGPIGIGTLLNALLSGILISFFLPYIARIVKASPKMFQKKAVRE